MKTMQSFTFALIFSALLISSNLFAAQSSNEKLTGVWDITAVITSDVTYKNWVGTMTITKTGSDYFGLLDWSCEEGGWHIQENFDVEKNGNNITMLGTEITIISSPDADSEYKLDNFSFTFDQSTSNTTPTSFTDAEGRTATFTITKN